MTKTYLPLFILTFLSLTTNLCVAKEVIHCSHSEICVLAEKILNENLVELRSEVVITGDPHDFAPKSDSIKKLMDAKILLAGPIELNPWMLKINEQRLKKKNTNNNEKKTISLHIEPTFKSKYPQASGEALAHFWLYPSVYCSLLNQLSLEVRKNNLSHLLKPDALTNEECHDNALKIEKEFMSAMKKLKLPLILTHDALFAYIIKAYPDPLKLIAIKGSGHHEEASPQSIKKLYQLLKNEKVIWLEEKGIHIPDNVLNKKRKNDIVISLDTAQSMNKANDKIISHTLLIFINKLNEIRP